MINKVVYTVCRSYVERILLSTNIKKKSWKQSEYNNIYHTGTDNIISLSIDVHKHILKRKSIWILPDEKAFRILTNIFCNSRTIENFQLRNTSNNELKIIILVAIGYRCRMKAQISQGLYVRQTLYWWPVIDRTTVYTQQAYTIQMFAIFLQILKTHKLCALMKLFKKKVLLLRSLQKCKGHNK